MPTWNRRGFVPAAIDCWMRQTYENRELLIVDDGDDPIRDLVPKDTRIRYVRLDERLTTGTKRNCCCELAAGEIVCNFDDDDWSAADRIEDQVRRMQETGKPITGYSTLLLWNIETKEAVAYVAAVDNYVPGTSLCFLRSYWKTRKFSSRQMASDNDFVFPSLKQIAATHDESRMVARIHSCHHTSPKDGLADHKIEISRIPPAFWENEKVRLG
jgi:O-antigen biosynthesis protein